MLLMINIIDRFFFDEINFITIKTGKDKYVLGEINASCDGFTMFLELSENIADEVLALLDAESAVNNGWAAFTR